MVEKGLAPEHVEGKSEGSISAHVVDEFIRCVCCSITPVRVPLGTVAIQFSGEDVWPKVSLFRPVYSFSCCKLREFLFQSSG